MAPEGYGGGEAAGGSPGRLIASGTTTIAAGATVTLATVTRLAGEETTVGGFPVADIAGLAAGAGSGFTIWIERTSTPQQFTVRASNGSGADRALEWWCRGRTP